MAKGTIGGGLIIKWHRLLMAAALLSPALTAVAAPPKKPTPPPPPARLILPLNGAWSTRLELPSAPATWQSEPAADAAQESQPSEHFFKASAPVWYWKHFSIPEAWQGKTRILRLQFDGIAEDAEVWLNGTSVGKHTGGGAPFDLTVTKAAKIGGENLLAVRVTSPTGRIGGIYRSVRLIAHDEAYLKSIIPVMDTYGHINLEIHLLNTSNISGGATIDVTLALADTPEKLLQKSNQEVLLTPGENISNFITSVRSKDLKTWFPNSPNVYLLKVVFHQAKDLLDEITLPIGFRTVGVKDGVLQLNNQPVNAVAPAPDYRLSAAHLGSDEEQKAREQVLSLKDSGVTLITLFNPSSELLRLTDVMGLPVVECVRVGLSAEEERLEAAALIERDRHHPSVIAWRLHHALTTDQLAAFHKLDSSRIIAAGKGSNAQVAAPGKGAFEGAAPAWLLSDR